MSDGNGNGAVAEGRTWDEVREQMTSDGVDLDAAAAFMAGGGDPYSDADWWEQLDAKYAECPDATTGTVQNARLVVAEYDKRRRIIPGTLQYKNVRNAQALDRMRERDGRFAKMAEWNLTPDPFAYGSEQAVPGVGGVLQSYVPVWPGPLTRQLYWQDYFAMSAKAFEAYNHDPISWRCVHMKQEFALGKGLEATVTYSSANQSKAGQRHDKAQAAWDEFWKRNRMDQRMDMFARDLSIMGEQFMRYFPQPKGLMTVRSLDPASVYDLITDPEDHETVFAYHQQFQTPWQIWAPQSATPPGGPQAPEGPTVPGTPAKFIIRQILPQEIDHYRLNTGAYERRGRSDLFPALGWIRRLRDYLTSHVIRADMLARIVWDLEVQGNAATQQAVRALLFGNGQPPQPGTIYTHNQATKLSAIAPPGSSGGSRWDPVMDALVTMVANSIGLPKDWLGFGMTTTRASALVATEPAARSLEELQGTVEMVLHDCFDRVMAQAKITDAEAEFTFPSIATEDRSAKLQDLAFAESMGWFAKQTASAIAAKELGVTGYDAEEEQGLIADEFENAQETETDTDGQPDPITGKKPEKPVQGDGVVRSPMISQKYEQARKLDPTRAIKGQEDEPPGLLVPFDGPAAAPGAPGGGNGASGNGGSGVGTPKAPPGTGASQKPAAGGASGSPTRAGMPSSENPLSAGGAKNLKSDLKEGERLYTEAEVTMLLEVAMRARGRRRRPDDPAFQAAEQRYSAASAENLADLVRAVPGGGEEQARNE